MKKILALALSTIMALSMVACAEKEPEVIPPVILDSEVEVIEETIVEETVVEEVTETVESEEYVYESIEFIETFEEFSTKFGAVRFENCKDVEEVKTLLDKVNYLGSIELPESEEKVLLETKTKEFEENYKDMTLEEAQKAAGLIYGYRGKMIVLNMKESEASQFDTSVLDKDNWDEATTAQMEAMYESAKTLKTAKMYCMFTDYAFEHKELLTKEYTLEVLAPVMMYTMTDMLTESFASANQPA